MAAEVRREEPQPQRPLGIARLRVRTPGLLQRGGMLPAPLGMEGRELGQRHVGAVLPAGQRIAVRDGVRGLDGQGPGITLQGFLGLALVLQHVAEVIVGLDIIRLQP